MKKKMISSLIMLIIAVITGVTLTVATTFAWYLGSLDTTQDFIVEADGVLYLYVPASVEATEKTLYPAKAMPHAVSNGMYMDALTEYDENDPNPSYVSQVASIVDYTTFFIFYNEHKRFVQATDEYGEPLYDEFGEPIYVQATDSQGEPMFDEQGDPIYETEPTPATISYQLAIKKTPDNESQDYIDIDELVIHEFYFSYDEQPISPSLPINEENGALDYLEVADDKTFGTVRVEGTVEVYIHMRLYLAKVDELMDPAIANTEFYIEVELAVTPEML